MTEAESKGKGRTHSNGAKMTQEELNALETSFRQQGLTWNQTNFAVAVIRNYVEPLRQQLAAMEPKGWWHKEVEDLKQRNSDLVTGLEACDEQVVALRQQLAESQKRDVMLRDIAEQSRGSVKTDLNRYELLLISKQKAGLEKSAQYIAMDIEANRLSKLLNFIDEALAATEPKP